MAPPESADVLDRIASALELRRGFPEYQQLMDLAAAAKGRIPQDLLSDEEVASRLPLLFRTLRSRPLSGEQLEKLIDSIRRDAAGAMARTNDQRDTRRLVAQLRDQVLAAARECGARNVRLFGSVARGLEGAASDIDFVVSLEPGRTLLDLTRLESRLERLLGRRVDVVTEGSLREPIRSTAVREAVPV